MVVLPVTRSAGAGACILALLLTTLTGCTDSDRTLGPTDPLPRGEVSSSLAYLEPAGMKLLASNDWAGFSTTAPAVGGNASGWYRYMAGNTGKVVVDAAAGCGSTSALQVTIPQGYTQGSGPEHLSVGASSTWFASQGTFTQVYLRYCVWVPANYYGSTSGVQKLFHIWGTTDAAAGGNTQAVPALAGVGTSALSHQLRLQNMSTKNGGPISFNLGCTAAARNRWDRVEVLLTQNSSGSANGVAKMWVNGTLCMQRTNLTWSGAARTGKRWTAVQLNPTYGGTGKVQTAQYIRYGAVRVSAK